MKNRCSNPRNSVYGNYGARGITVCEEWRDSFDAFQSWAYANGYREGLSIDRIDNSGDYTPENCRWTTYKEQERNRRNNHVLTYNGESKTVSEWAEIFGLSGATIRYRVKRGWPIERALTEPVKKKE